MKLKKVNSENKKIFLYGLIMVVVLTVTVILLVSKANFRVTATYELAEGKVTSSPYDFNTIAMYISDSNGIEVKNNRKYNELKDTRMPSEGYVISKKNSYCYIGTKDNIDSNAKLYTNENGEHIISNLTKGDKCVLYFEKISDKCGSACKTIIANTDLAERNTELKSFNVPYAETNSDIYEAEDDEGTSYYFAGNPTNNWVEFGGYYWRIIRVNGNGSIRMIYQGTEPNVTGEGTQIGASAFNSSYDNNRYVGYMYGEDGELRGLTYPSNAYTELNKWFENSNIKLGTSYFNLIDKDIGFCGDRTPSTTSIPSTTSPYNIGDGSGGTKTTATYYGAYLRLRPKGEAVTKDSTTVTPTLKCLNSSDLYTYSEANQGNATLANPIGMITADEAAYAGLVSYVSSTGNYLYTNQRYWTMSPYGFGTEFIKALIFAVHEDGWLHPWWLYTSNINIRPVINIRSDVKLSGSGTIDNPYTVS
ncbi:MAG: hypothetical protein NC483_04635 [Ruminococcus sp.]|nr:hypothetical protein [Ruminococcus sp.]